MSLKTLVVVTGPTAGGKTELAIGVARALGAEIIGADSRQMFRGIEITTAAPTAAQLAAVPHHMVGFLDLDDYYSAARYETDTLALLDRLWKRSDYAVMCGGSMMYIDAVCHGIDMMPTVSDQVRNAVRDIFESTGIGPVTAMLEKIDPEYASRVDPANTRRIIHAVEVSMEAGVPYSSLLTGKHRERPFSIVKVAIDRPREELFDRINRRVDAMVDAGMEEEARRVYPLRGLNSLNTVGLKEMFAFFDGVMDRDTAIARIAKNTRVYAKKQLTWMKRDPSVNLLHPSTAVEDTLALVM